MLSIFVALALMQTQARTDAIADKEYMMPCPEGHKFPVIGRQEGTYFLLRLKSDAPAQNFGIDLAKMPAHENGAAWHGGNVEYRTAGAPGQKLNRVHVTLIGSQVERESARKNLEADPGFRALAAEMGDGLAVQDYGPENPLVKDIGLVGGGKPDVVIQTTRGGRVFYRARSYAGADVIVNEIRKANPQYDASKDPDGTTFGSLTAILKSLGLPANMDPQTTEIVIGAVAGLAVILYLKRAES